MKAAILSFSALLAGALLCPGGVSAQVPDKPMKIQDQCPCYSTDNGIKDAMEAVDNALSELSWGFRRVPTTDVMIEIVEDPAEPGIQQRIFGQVSFWDTGGHCHIEIYDEGVQRTPAASGTILDAGEANACILGFRILMRVAQDYE